MVLQPFEEQTMGGERTLFLRYLLAHCDGDVPGPIAIVANAAQLLAHQAVAAGINNLLKFRCDRIESMKHPLCHKPARLRREALKAIELVGWTLGFGTGNIFHGIGRPMTVT